MTSLDAAQAVAPANGDSLKNSENANVLQGQNNAVPQMHQASDISSHAHLQTHKNHENATTTNQSNNSTYANQHKTSPPSTEHSSDPDALTKLLEHIESLKQSNAEMSATLENIQEKNMENYHIEVEDKIKPWVSSLNIPPEQKESFLRGIQIACEQGMKKRGIVDFKSNPAFSIACAAAQAHGTLIENAEKIRLELLEANNRVAKVKEEESTNYNNNRQRQHAILSSALTYDAPKDAGAGQKRTIEDVYNTKAEHMVVENPSSCWDAVFSAMDQGKR